MKTIDEVMTELDQWPGVKGHVLAIIAEFERMDEGAIERLRNWIPGVIVSAPFWLMHLDRLKTSPLDHSPAEAARKLQEESEK